MDLKILNRVSQFPKIVDFEDLKRSGLFQLSFSYQKSVRLHVFNFGILSSTQHHIYVGQSRTKYTKTKSVNKSTRSSRPPRFHEMLINEQMSGICPFDTRKNRCHLSPTMTTIAMPVMWPLNHKLPINWQTNVDTADSTQQTTMLKNSKPLRSKQVRPWFS